ncbi:peptide-methionine (S)-S-oxide reductase MsrA [Parachitinimonas caeni]|uniref:Peptide methionine sulfoxide reductase MsrA n=1 Tax=Parachitinimonas caeni TaxID=3031301 RepID=A0ABT7E316_9NEIS|nr:peptide-methionine (S)-S-oxide reductase MsrA [Parachitinimonas caeni]MDK2125307.1 peptide-methionine (S)-S-oxide reductase MsrA [Parachitinimonas caeni]
MSQSFNSGSDHDIATLAGGCFWCLEAVFQQLKGVDKVVSGYIAGHVADPSYREVCSGETGHAEAVQILFRPAEISFADLLDVFFAIHDPTTLNRQGNDVGTQYRSGIYYHSTEQKRIAEQMITRLDAEQRWTSRIVTELVPASHFYPAEPYHQHYFENNARQPYCQLVVEPKVAKAKAKFGAKMRR